MELQQRIPAGLYAIFCSESEMCEIQSPHLVSYLATMTNDREDEKWKDDFPRLLLQQDLVYYSGSQAKEYGNSREAKNGSPIECLGPK